MPVSVFFNKITLTQRMRDEIKFSELRLLQKLDIKISLKELHSSLLILEEINT